MRWCLESGCFKFTSRKARLGTCTHVDSMSSESLLFFGCCKMIEYSGSLLKDVLRWWMVSTRSSQRHPWTHVQFPAAFVVSVSHCAEVFVLYFVQAENEEASFLGVLFGNERERKRENQKFIRLCTADVDFVLFTLSILKRNIGSSNCV